MPRHHKKIIDVASTIVLLALIILAIHLWVGIFTVGTKEASLPALYFLPVTAGESILLRLPNNVTILTDAGSDASIVDDLQNIAPPDMPPYIDIAIISYPQIDDYAGYEYLLEHYQIGAFIYNGRADNTKSTEWKQLMENIATKHIPLITLGAGDSIHYGPAERIDVLSPDSTFIKSAEPSDTGMVLHITTPKFTALLATDIGSNVENALMASSSNISKGLRAEILKAPLPGVDAAAGDAFLHAVAAQTIVIEPGAKGTASQPTKTMLAHLSSSTDATISSPKQGSFLLYNK